MIRRVEYDSESNKLIGFALPLNEKEVFYFAIERPISNSYFTTSFISIEEATTVVSFWH